MSDMPYTRQLTTSTIVGKVSLCKNYSEPCNDIHYFYVASPANFWHHPRINGLLINVGGGVSKNPIQNAPKTFPFIN